MSVLCAGMLVRGEEEWEGTKVARHVVPSSSSILENASSCVCVCFCVCVCVCAGKCLAGV